MKKMIFIFLFTYYFIYSQSDSYKIEIDWENNNLILNTEVKIPRVKKNRAAAFYNTEDNAKFSILNHIIKKIMDIRIDSNNILQNYSKLDMDRVMVLSSSISENIISNSVISKDLKKINIFYKIPFYSIISNLIVDYSSNQEKAYKFNWISEDIYTGLVIYAADPLPIRGQNNKESLNPAIFAKIYNNDFDVILDKGIMDSDIFENRGTFIYTTDLNYKDYKALVGDHPLEILANEIYGQNYTDLVIDKSITDNLLYNKDNYDILKKGKIVVIISKDRISEIL